MAAHEETPDPSEIQGVRSAPPFIPPEVQRAAALENRHDRRHLFTRLRFLMQANGMLAEPQYFITHDYAANRRRHVLSIPLGRSSIQNPDVFIGINIKGPHPDPDHVDDELLEMSAFNVRFSGSRVVMKDTVESVKPKDGLAWPVGDGFGPYFYIHDAPNSGKIMELKNWKLGQTLKFNKAPNRSLNLDENQEHLWASKLIDLIASMGPDDRQTFTLIPTDIIDPGVPKKGK